MHAVQSRQSGLLLGAFGRFSAQLLLLRLSVASSHATWIALKHATSRPPLLLPAQHTRARLPEVRTHHAARQRVFEERLVDPLLQLLSAHCTHHAAPCTGLMHAKR
jgi:hypothetical protein